MDPSPLGQTHGITSWRQVAVVEAVEVHWKFITSSWLAGWLAGRQAGRQEFTRNLLEVHCEELTTGSSAPEVDHKLAAWLEVDQKFTRRPTGWQAGSVEVD